ncbi:MAG: RING finger protein [Candidatus Hodarchaeota archaeon]
MTTRVTNLTRLSRNKTTGNFIISLVILLNSALLLIGFSSGFSSLSNSIFVSFGVFFCLISLYIVNRQLRKPFFLEYSRYFDELGERRLKIQKTVVLVDLIEPLQTLFSVKTALIQLDELYTEMKNVAKVTSSELSLNSSTVRTQQISSTLQALMKFSDSTIDQIVKKREKMIYLANIRKIIFDSIAKRLSRPKNKIETDYLRYKVEELLKDKRQDIEDCLVQQILTHALDQGEIIGRIEQENNGEKLLSIVRLAGKNEEVLNINTWINSKQSEVQCIICRHKIHHSELNTKCPHCGNSFHRTHLLEWLKVFGHCPICHQRIYSA